MMLMATSREGWLTTTEITQFLHDPANRISWSEDPAEVLALIGDYVRSDPPRYECLTKAAEMLTRDSDPDCLGLLAEMDMLIRIVEATDQNTIIYE